jgi:hypothetical protein
MFGLLEFLGVGVVQANCFQAARFKAICFISGSQKVALFKAICFI